MIFISFLRLACICVIVLIESLHASNSKIRSLFNLVNRSTTHSKFKRSNRNSFAEIVNELTNKDDDDPRKRDISNNQIEDIYVLISDEALKIQTIKDLDETTRKHQTPKNYYLNRQNRHAYRLEDFLRQNIILTISDFFTEKILCNLDVKLLLNDKNCKHLVEHNRNNNNKNNGDTSSIMTRIFARKIDSRISLEQINLLKENFKTHYRIGSSFSSSSSSFSSSSSPMQQQHTRLKLVIVISNSLLLNSFKSFFSHVNISLLGVDIQKFFDFDEANTNVPFNVSKRFFFSVYCFNIKILKDGFVLRNSKRSVSKTLSVLYRIYLKT